MTPLIRPHHGVSPVIDDTAFIAEGAVVIGDVRIGAGSSIWYGCVVRGDVNSITIGSNTNIQDGTIIHVNHDRPLADGGSDGGMATVIGDDITVGHMALLHACTLESGSFVGMRAVVMDGAVVESGAMVAAGALLTPGKRVRSGELWGGSPARIMRKLSSEELEGFAYSARHYAKLATGYRERS